MAGGEKHNIRIWIGVAAVIAGIGIVLAIRNRRKVVRFSEMLVGQTEIAGNAGFTNEEFQKLMDEVGWEPGDAWCVYFAKLVWFNMAPSWLKAKILNKVSGSSLQTWENLKDDANFKTSAIPQAGDMAIWRVYENGNPTWKGHAGIVKRLGFGNFTTIEGNSSDNGMGNEGYVVAEKTRSIDFTNKNGLRLIGFIRFA